MKIGRASLAHLIAHYTKRTVPIREAAILIRINKLYHYGMSEAELYDATRSSWKLGEKKGSVHYAFAVFEGVVREVYKITGWVPGGTSFAAQNKGERRPRPGRWEFVGTLAEPRMRQRYINSYVGHLFAKGAQNPISYVNVKP
jgi:hypothetical protein